MPQGLTLEQLKAMGAQPKQSAGGLTLEQLKGMGAVPKQETSVVPAPTTPVVQQVAPATANEPKTTLLNAIPNFAVGFAKGIADLPREAAAAGGAFGKFLAKKAFGPQVAPPSAAQQALDVGTQQTALTKPVGAAQRAGFGTEKVAEFFVPGAAPAKAARAVEVATGLSKAKGVLGAVGRLAPRAAIEAGTAGAQTYVQTGGDAEAAKTAAKLGGAFGAGTKVLGGIGKAAKPLFGDFAERTINSLVKPLQKDFAYGKNPGRGVANEGIVANSFDELMSKISSKREEIGKAIGEKLDAARNYIVVNDDVLAPLDSAISSARKTPRVNQGLIERLEDARNDLLDFIGQANYVTPKQAFELKQLVADLTKFTGNPSDDKALNAALKQIYGRVKEKINNAVPGVSELNERFADIKSAEVAAKYRDKIMERSNIIPIASRVGGLIAGFNLAGLLGAVAGALVSGGVERGLSSTALKTRVAKSLLNLSKEEAASAARNPLIIRIFGSPEEAQKAVVEAVPEAEPLLLSQGNIRLGERTGMTGSPFKEGAIKTPSVQPLKNMNVLSSSEKSIVEAVQSRFPLETVEDWKAAINTVRSQNGRFAKALAEIAAKLHQSNQEQYKAFIEIVRSIK